MATRLSGNRFAALASDTFLGDGSHLADDNGSHLVDDIVVAFAFYNVGIQNTELLSAKWQKRGCTKKEKLKTDIKATFWDASSFHFRVWQHVR